MLNVFEEIVNEVNAVFVYKTDKKLYGVEEYWGELKEVDGKLYGDCEDHSFTIANRSIEAGIPSEDLAIHLVALDRLPDHIVLCYRGKWWADCNSKKVLTRLPYKKISFRQLDQTIWQHS